MPRSRFFSTLILTALALGAAADEPSKPPVDFPGLKYRLLGPFTGGRATRAAGLPGDAFTYYMTTASSGVWKSTDGGKTWQLVLKKDVDTGASDVCIDPNMPKFTDFATVSLIEASPFDAGTAYVVVEGHRLDDMKPYLYKTADYGKALYSFVIENDGVPTPGAREVFATYKGEMDALASEWKALLAGEIAALNQMSQPAIVIP